MLGGWEGGAGRRGADSVNASMTLRSGVGRGREGKVECFECATMIVRGDERG